MFSNGFHESSAAVVTLSDIAYPVFIALIRFLYTDQLPPPCAESLVLPLLQQSQKMGLTRLSCLCQRQLEARLDPHNAAAMLEAADTHHALPLRTSCLRYILQNFSLVSRTHSFLVLREDLLREVLFRRAKKYPSESMALSGGGDDLSLPLTPVTPGAVPVGPSSLNSTVMGISLLGLTNTDPGSGHKRRRQPSRERPSATHGPASSSDAADGWHDASMGEGGLTASALSFSLADADAEAEAASVSGIPVAAVDSEGTTTAVDNNPSSVAPSVTPAPESSGMTGPLGPVAPSSGRSSVGVDPRARNIKRQRNKLTHAVAAPVMTTTSNEGDADPSRGREFEGDGSFHMDADDDEDEDDVDEGDIDGDISDGSAMMQARNDSASAAAVAAAAVAAANAHAMSGYPQMLHPDLLPAAMLAYRGQPAAIAAAFDPMYVAAAMGQVPVLGGPATAAMFASGKPGTYWPCTRCSFHNEPVTDVCRMCSCPR